jgi:hypothetical protein
MKKQMVLVYFIIHAVMSGKGQAFTKEYSLVSGSNWGGNWSVMSTTDKGYAICIGSDSSLNQVTPIIKTDSLGEIQWVRQYQAPGYELSISANLAQAPDSGFILPALYGDAGAFIRNAVIKTDKNGNVQWSKTCGDTLMYVILERALALPDGYLISGQYEDTVASIDGIVFFKIDFNGNTVWTKTIEMGGAGYSNEDVQYTIYTSTGHILAALTTNTDPWGEPVLLKMDLSGNIVFLKKYNATPDGAGPYHVMEDNAGNFVMVGATFNFGSGGDWDAYIIKFDSNGNFLWGRTIGEAGIPDEAYSVVQMPNGDYVIGGEMESYYGYTSQTALIRFSNSGTFISMKLLNPDADGSFPLNLVKNTDGGITVFRTESNYSNEGNLSIMRTDPALNTSCFEMPVLPTVINFSTTQASMGTVGTMSGEYTVTTTSGLLSIEATPICMLNESEMNASKQNYFVYPNPAANAITFSFSNQESEEYDLVLYDMQGRQVKIINGITGNTVTVNIKDLEEGMYFFNLSENQQVKAQGKIIVSR